MIKKGLKWGAVPLLAALLAVGCSKEDRTPGLRIMEENMKGDGAKVWVDPSNVQHNSWVAGERVVCCPGGSQIVAQEGSNYYIDYTPSGSFVAAYPCYQYEYPDDSVFKMQSGCAILRDITATHWIADDGSMKVDFPMVAFGDASTGNLMFKHVTGVISFVLENTTNEDYPIYMVEFETYKNGNCHRIFPRNDYRYPDHGLFCTLGAGGELNLDLVADRYYGYNDIRDAEGNDGAGGYYVLKAGTSIRLYLPVFPTENTDIRLIVHKAAYNSVNAMWDDASSVGRDDEYINRRIEGVTVERNHIVNLPKVQF